MSHETSFNQLQEQIDAGHQTPTVLVERSNGEITTGQYTGLKGAEGKYTVVVPLEDGTQGTKKAAAEGLTDQYQEKLAEQLAGKPLRNLGENALAGTGVEKPAAKEASPEKNPQEAELEAKIKAIQAEYSDDDALDLWRYWAYTANSAESRRRGDSGSATGEQQEAGQAYQRLNKKFGEKGTRDAQRYAELSNQLKRVRGF